MLVTELPKSTEVKLEQLEKAYWPMVSTCVPDKSSEVKLVQSKKDSLAMLVSELPKSIDVRLEHP